MPEHTHFLIKYPPGSGGQDHTVPIENMGPERRAAFAANGRQVIPCDAEGNPVKEVKEPKAPNSRNVNDANNPPRQSGKPPATEEEVITLLEADKIPLDGFTSAGLPKVGAVARALEGKKEVTQELVAAAYGKWYAARVEKVVKVIEGLDPNNPEHYTKEGHPKLAPLSEGAGFKVDDALRDAAMRAEHANYLEPSD